MSKRGVFSSVLLISIWGGQFLRAQDGKSFTLTPIDSTSLTSEVYYISRDSMRFDLEEQKLYLYGDANVNYEEIELRAGYVAVDLSNNTVVAAGIDSAGKLIQRPVLGEGDKETKADTIKYNFKTKKGWMYMVETSEGEAYMYAYAGKKDSDNVYYVKDARYTTCDDPHPHFWIQVTKGKVIPDDKIVTGPAYLVIAGVPTPLAVPFGFFPNKRGRTNGILLPVYGESPGLGFFLKDGGFYFGVSDYYDLAIKGDIYSKGSFGVKTFSNYNRRYRYNGNIALGYSNFRNSYIEFPDFSIQEDFFVRWSHTQDPKRNPSVRFSANVNVLSSNYYKLNSNNSTDYLSNTFQSNITWSKSWKRFNLSTNASHSQNTLTRKVDLSLPRISLSMNRLFPATFLNKSGVARNKWYDKIGITYSSDFENRVSVADSNLFIPTITDSMRYAFKHNVPVSANWSLKKLPFTISPNFTYTSLWYFRTVEKTFDPDSDAVVTNTKEEFRMANFFSTGVSVSTKVYGMFTFKKGKVKAIRHVMNPMVSFSYRPDYGKESYGYYNSYTTPSSSTAQLYSIFENGIYGAPPRGETSQLGFSLNNNLEMKVKPGVKDTSAKDKKVTLLESFGISSAYNYAAKDFNLSPFNIYARTKLFNRLDLNLLGVLDPYKLNEETGNRYDQFVFDEGKLGRLTAAGISVSTSFASKKKSDKEKEKNRKKEKGSDYKYVSEHPDYYVDFDVPVNLRVAYNLTYSKPDTTSTVTQSFTFSGDINLTDKWKIGFNSGYDFVREDFTYTNISIYRDLHCWEMQFNWIPFGFRKSYTIDIRVKASVLQDLKLSRKRDWYDYN